MLLPDLIYLSLSLCAFGISVLLPDEIAKIMSRGIGLLLLFVSIACAPWLVLLILVVPLLSSRFIGRLQV